MERCEALNPTGIGSATAQLSRRILRSADDAGCKQQYFDIWRETPETISPNAAMQKIPG